MGWVFVHIRSQQHYLQQPKGRNTSALRDEWINTMQSIHAMEQYSALKRKEILTHVTTWMNHEDVTLYEIRQSHKGRWCMILLL